MGPLLYLLYTAPFGGLIRWHHMEFHLYADDTQRYTTFSCDDSVDLITTISQIGSCLFDITNWITTNKLKLNTDKTELFILYSRIRLPRGFLPLKQGLISSSLQKKRRAISASFSITPSQCLFISTI